jgi:hypothetical protein
MDEMRMSNLKLLMVDIYTIVLRPQILFELSGRFTV